jgi:hypothetical protein
MEKNNEIIYSKNGYDYKNNLKRKKVYYRDYYDYLDFKNWKKILKYYSDALKKDQKIISIMQKTNILQHLEITNLKIQLDKLKKNK